MEQRKTNEELAARVKAGIDIADNMLQLWQQNRGIIHQMAKRFYGVAEIEDLEQEGYLALYTAVDGFEPEMGFRFITYAQRIIYQAMVRYVQRCSPVHVSIHDQENMRKYETYRKQYSAKYGCMPVPERAAAALGMSLKEVLFLERAAEATNMQSLDAPLADDESSSFGELLPAAGMDVEGEVIERMERQELQATLWGMVRTLQDEQADVIIGKYAGNQSLRKVSEVMGISEERVNSLYYAGMKELRSPAKKSKLRRFLPDEVHHHAYRQIGVKEFNCTWTSSTEKAALKSYFG